MPKNQPPSHGEVLRSLNTKSDPVDVHVLDEGYADTLAGMSEWAREKQSQMSQSEKNDLRDQHLMKCPKCGMDLHTVEFKGFKVERCVNCQGTWLDAGEMEQLLEHEHPILNSFKHIFS